MENLQEISTILKRVNAAYIIDYGNYSDVYFVLDNKISFNEWKYPSNNDAFNNCQVNCICAFDASISNLHYTLRKLINIETNDYEYKSVIILYFIILYYKFPTNRALFNIKEYLFNRYFNWFYSKITSSKNIPLNFFTNTSGGSLMCYLDVNIRDSLNYFQSLIKLKIEPSFYKVFNNTPVSALKELDFCKDDPLLLNLLDYIEKKDSPYIYSMKKIDIEI
jgi:hypothetical protein